MLPPFDEHGNLPQGIHAATKEEVSARFATKSARRQWLGHRLRQLLGLAKAAGPLERVFLWGSFVTAKESPNDLDILLVMGRDFSLDATPPECRALFDYAQATIRFATDVFWTKASIEESSLELWLDTYQIAKDYRRKGIVEIVSHD